MTLEIECKKLLNKRSSDSELIKLNATMLEDDHEGEKNKMRTISARNQLMGKVSAIFEGSVNNEVIITLDNGDEIVTVITKQSCKTLGIGLEKEVMAIIKAPWVVLANPDSGFAFSARNQFEGTIEEVIKGAVNSTVRLITQKGLSLTAVVTNESVDEMALEVGKQILGLVKASSIIVGTHREK